MLICSEPAFLPTSLFATDFPIQSGYNFLDGRGGDDCCVSGQRIPVQRFDRLSSGAGGGTAGGNSPAPRTAMPSAACWAGFMQQPFSCRAAAFWRLCRLKWRRGAAGAGFFRPESVFSAADDADLCDSLALWRELF